MSTQNPSLGDPLENPEAMEQHEATEGGDGDALQRELNGDSGLAEGADASTPPPAAGEGNEKEAGDPQETQQTGEDVEGHAGEGATGREGAILERLLRLQAEMDNLRKRTERDVRQARAYALVPFVEKLLPVLDSLHLGMQAAADDGNATDMRKGMALIEQQLLDAFAGFGVVEIDPAGQKFDPMLHEAISQAESPDHDSGLVVTVFQKGYSLNDRLLRPAKVVVAK